MSSQTLDFALVIGGTDGSIMRGGHIFSTLPVSGQRIHNHGDKLDLRVCLNPDTMDRQLQQRARPSNGEPTKKERGDLWQVLGASHRDYERFMASIRDSLDSCNTISELFNLCERAQCLGTVISDLNISEGRFSHAPENMDMHPKIDWHDTPRADVNDLPAKQTIKRSKEVDLLSSKPIAPIDVEFPPFPRGRIALGLLHDAYNYAQQLGRGRGDFAEEIHSLRQHGLTNGDLRWLVCSGFVEHGRETTELGQERRQFDHDRGLCFSPTTCFVLTESGASHVSRCFNAPTENEATPSMQAKADEFDDPKELPIPAWDRERQELRIGKTIVKQFKVPARNQETILATFQEEDWPVSIDDPLPLHVEIDPKRRLHDTINSLNRNQKTRLIRFRGNGSGEGILWELVQPSDSAD